MRLAAKSLLPGTGRVAFKQLMDLLRKRFLPRGSLALFDFHTIKAVCDATISFIKVGCEGQILSTLYP